MFKEYGFEQKSSEKDQMPKETKIVLEFMRHGEKDPNKEESKKAEEKIRLTANGRKMANEKGEQLDAQPKVALAMGSIKERTQETSYRSMLPQLEQDLSLEEIEKQIADKLVVGKKMKIDDRLDFGVESQGMKDAYAEKRYLQFLLEESDQQVLNEGDQISSCYSRFAGNIAEIIQKYVEIGNNFNKIASETDKYEEYGNQLERYIGTHQGIIESFLSKAIEKHWTEKMAGEFGREKAKEQGIIKRNEFVESVGGGFKPTQSIHVEIVNHGKEQLIAVTYDLINKEGIERKETIEFTPQLLQDIIDERKDFDKKVAANKDN